MSMALSSSFSWLKSRNRLCFLLFLWMNISIQAFAPVCLASLQPKKRAFRSSRIEKGLSAFRSSRGEKGCSVRNRRQRRPFFPVRRNFRIEGEDERETALSSSKTVLSSVSPKLTTSKLPSLLKKSSLYKKKYRRKKRLTVRSVHELRRAILQDGLLLKDVTLQKQQDDKNSNNKSQISEEAQEDVSSLLNHEVIELIAQRFKDKSLPGKRLDKKKLALAIEGGGMRGAVSAGMAAAIACLGLDDCFDVVYGSSAGSVVGAYFVSRQMCVDIYTHFLPHAKRTFVCKRRILSNLLANLLHVATSSVLKQETTDSLLSTKTSSLSPGMNISYVLEGILGQDGLRPLNMDLFRVNNAKQPLRIAASTVTEDGEMKSVCFGTEDFFGSRAVSKELVNGEPQRRGLHACLEASMTVPGATGPPVTLQWNETTATTLTKKSTCFDAFCYEPIPYRSAVEEGATHVLVLRTRPSSFTPKTQPGIYETAVAALYFQTHGHEQVGRFFQKGGQQYLYTEDLLTLEESARTNKPIAVPPPVLFYGGDDSSRKEQPHCDSWKKAHLLPIVVPGHVPELATLEQDAKKVRDAVRSGFAAAYNLLAPVVGLVPDGDSSLTGERVAELVFPEMDDMNNNLEETAKSSRRSQDPLPCHDHTDEEVYSSPTFTTKNSEEVSRAEKQQLQHPYSIVFNRPRHIPGDYIGRRRRARGSNQDVAAAVDISSVLNEKSSAEYKNAVGSCQNPVDCCHRRKQEASHLLSSLPGLRGGRMVLFSEALKYHGAK